jgi:transposase
MTISRSSLYDWLDKFRRGGYEALETRVAPGAKPLITPEMDDWLKGTVLSCDPTDYGYDTPLWTCEILAALLAQEFGVRVIAATVNAHLKKLGLSYQVPHYRAREQDPAEIERFLNMPTFYSWYRRYLDGGVEALEDRKPTPRRVWNKVPPEIRQEVVEMALEEPPLSPRELATAFTDQHEYFVCESTVYRLLKEQGLITSPTYILDAGSRSFRAADHRGQSAVANGLHLLQGHRLGLAVSLDRAR